LLLKKWQNLIVQYISSRDWCLGCIELAESNFAVSVNKRLLVDTAYAFEVTDIERVLRAQVAWVCGFNLTARFVIVFLLLKSCDLGIAENNSVARYLSSSAFKRFLKFSRL